LQDVEKKFMLQDAIRWRSHKSGSEAVRTFSFDVAYVRHIKWNFCLLNFYSECLGALLLTLNEGGVHNPSLLIMGCCHIRSIIDVTSQYATRPCQKWYKTSKWNVAMSHCVTIKIYEKPCSSDKRIWIRKHYRLTAKQ